LGLVVQQSHRLEPRPRLLPRGWCQSTQAAGQHGSAAEHHFVTGAAQCVRRTTGGSCSAPGCWWPRPAAGWGHTHMYGLCPHAVLRRDSQTPSVGAFLRECTNFRPYPVPCAVRRVRCNRSALMCSLPAVGEKLRYVLTAHHGRAARYAKVWSHNESRPHSPSGG